MPNTGLLSMNLVQIWYIETNCIVSHLICLSNFPKHFSLVQSQLNIQNRMLFCRFFKNIIRQHQTDWNHIWFWKVSNWERSKFVRAHLLSRMTTININSRNRFDIQSMYVYPFNIHTLLFLDRYWHNMPDVKYRPRLNSVARVAIRPSYLNLILDCRCYNSGPKEIKKFK